MYQSGKTAEEVYADGIGGAVERFGKLYVIVGAFRAADQRDRRYRNTLVDDRNSVFLFDIAAGLYELFGAARDLVVDLVTGLFDIVGLTVEKRNAHGDGTDVEVLLADHIDGFKNVFCVQHDVTPFVECG